MFDIRRTFWLAIAIGLTLDFSESSCLAAEPEVGATSSSTSPSAALNQATSTEKLAVNSYEELCSLAQATAAASFAPLPPIPDALKQLTYDDYMKISFNRNKAIWRFTDKPFWLEAFHLGFVQQTCVELFKVSDGQVSSIDFDPSRFKYKDLFEGETPPTAPGYAGLRIVGETPEDDFDEMLTFLGASYFRAHSQSTVYGSSARGIAINVALNQPEEFPAFRAFWIFEPQAGDTELKVLALLDGPTLSGAYQFTFTPGKYAGKMDVKARLFLRSTPDKLAIAPITSMWMWGDGLPAPALEHRQSVHDSDGLLIHSDDAGWVWRPYARQAYPSVSHRRCNKLYGFGLLQRDREKDHYMDENAIYYKRPSVWVEPKQPWVNGRIELLELPGAHEGVDSIGAFWIADEIASPEKPLDIEYTLSFFSDGELEHPKLSNVEYFEVNRSETDRSVTLELFYANIPELNLDDVHVGIVTANGRLLDQHWGEDFDGDPEMKWPAEENKILHRHPKLRRLVLKLEPDGDGPIDLTVRLQPKSAIDSTEAQIAEVFSYLVPPRNSGFTFPAVYTREE